MYGYSPAIDSISLNICQSSLNSHDYHNESSYFMSIDSPNKHSKSTSNPHPPMESKDHHSSESKVSLVNYENIIHQRYASLRKTEIEYLTNVSQGFRCDSMILYKAISYLDRIFIESSCKYNVREMAIICLSLSMKYNGSCMQIKIKELCSELKTSIENYQHKEIACLQYLNYDLNQLSSYDIIEQLFKSDSFTQHHKTNNINALHLDCLELHHEIIVDERAIDFTPDELAYSIMKIILCDKHSLFSLKQLIKTGNDILKTIHLFSFMNLMRCCFVIKAICFNENDPSIKRRNSQAMTVSSSSTNDSK